MIWQDNEMIDPCMHCFSSYKFQHISFAIWIVGVTFKTWYSQLKARHINSSKVRNYCVARLCPLIFRHGSFLLPRETGRAKPSRDGESWYCFKTGITVLPLLARVRRELGAGRRVQGAVRRRKVWRLAWMERNLSCTRPTMDRNKFPTELLHA